MNMTSDMELIELQTLV